MSSVKLSEKHRITIGTGKHKAVVDATIAQNKRLTVLPGHKQGLDRFDFHFGSNTELVKNIAKGMLEAVKIAEGSDL